MSKADAKRILNDVTVMHRFNAVTADERIAEILSGEDSVPRAFLRRALFQYLWVGNHPTCAACGANEGFCVESTCWRLRVTQALELHTKWATKPYRVEFELEVEK